MEKFWAQMVLKSFTNILGFLRISREIIHEIDQNLPTIRRRNEISKLMNTLKSPTKVSPKFPHVLGFYTLENVWKIGENGLSGEFIMLQMPLKQALGHFSCFRDQS